MLLFFHNTDLHFLESPPEPASTPVFDPMAQKLNCFRVGENSSFKFRLCSPIDDNQQNKTKDYNIKFIIFDKPNYKTKTTVTYRSVRAGFVCFCFVGGGGGGYRMLKKGTEKVSEVG